MTVMTLSLRVVIVFDLFVNPNKDIRYFFLFSDVFLLRLQLKPFATIKQILHKIKSVSYLINQQINKAVNKLKILTTTRTCPIVRFVIRIHVRKYY